MADIERLKRALIAADAAGDTEAATALAQEIRKTEPPKDDVVRSNIFPVSKDSKGNYSFDSDAGLFGMAKRIASGPGDVLTGKVNPLGPEGVKLATESALAMSPLPAASRAAGPRAFMASQKTAIPKAPTEDALKAASKAAYKAVEDMGVKYKGRAVNSTASNIISLLNKEKFYGTLAPKTHALLEKLRSGPRGSHVEIESIEAARKILGKIAGGPDATEATAAVKAMQGLEKFMEGVQPSQLVVKPGSSIAKRYSAGSDEAREAAKEAARIARETAKAASGKLREARGNYAAMSRSKRISEAERDAGLQAAAANSGKNMGNALRQKAKSLLLSDKKIRGFSQKEIDALEQVVNGTATENTLRRVSNLLGGGGGLGQTLLTVGAGGVGYASGLGPVATALTAATPGVVGSAARSASNALTKRHLKGVGAGVRSRSPLYRQMLTDAPSTVSSGADKQAIIRMLMGGQAAPQKIGPNGGIMENGVEYF